jgi:hypothetical protein
MIGANGDGPDSRQWSVLRRVPNAHAGTPPEQKQAKPNRWTDGASNEQWSISVFVRDWIRDVGDHVVRPR